jgi:hypothetical protein
MITSNKLHLVEGIVLDSLPQGYGIQRCQGTPTLQIQQRRTDTKVAGEHRTAESVIALAQIIFATVSLYRSRGDQFTRYGFAAFSLTVLPFAVMSFANLVANILSLDYTKLYLVETLELLEAQQRGTIVTGVVGRLQTEMRPTSEVSFKREGNTLLAWRKVNSKLVYLGIVIPSTGVGSSPVSRNFQTRRRGANQYTYH